jgi:hypothetical protein
MINPQSFNSQKRLFHLVCFGSSFAVLNVDSGIPRPGHFVNSMAAPALPRLPEKMITYLAQILKPDIAWIPPHLSKDVFNVRHLKK